MIENPAKARNSPKECEANRYSPEQHGSTVTTWVWRCRCLSGKGLRRSGTKPGGEGVGSLLIHHRGRYDVRGSASVALIGRLLLNNGSHLIVPDLAKACDTWFLNTDSSAVLSRSANSTQKHGARFPAGRSEIASRTLKLGLFPNLVPVRQFDRVFVQNDSPARHGCPEQPGPGEKNA